VHEWEVEVSVRDPLEVGEDDLPTNPGSGNPLGVRMRTLRDGLGGNVGSDVFWDSVGGGARLGVLREEDGAGDGACLSSIDFVDSTSTSRAHARHFHLSALVPPPPPSHEQAGPQQAAKSKSTCQVSFADPSTPRGAALHYSCPFPLLVARVPRAPHPCSWLQGCYFAALWLSVSMGRYCDCLNPDEAFCLVFSCMVSMSSCMRLSASVRNHIFMLLSTLKDRKYAADIVSP